MELFALGVVIGGLVNLGICVFELWRSRKSPFKDDGHERTLIEYHALIKDLDSKYLDLYSQLDQMRGNLAKNSFNGLPKVKDRLDALIEEYKLDKRYNKENFQQLSNSIGSIRERLYSSEGKSY